MTYTCSQRPSIQKNRCVGGAFTPPGLCASRRLLTMTNLTERGSFRRSATASHAAATSSGRLVFGIVCPGTSGARLEHGPAIACVPAQAEARAVVPLYVHRAERID